VFLSNHSDNKAGFDQHVNNKTVKNRWLTDGSYNNLMALQSVRNGMYSCYGLQDKCIELLPYLLWFAG